MSLPVIQCLLLNDWEKTMRSKAMRMAGGIAFLLLFATLFTSGVCAQDKVTTDEAKKIAKEAYIFNYPLVMMYRTMYLQAIDTKSKSYSGGFGKWLHLGTSSPKDTDIVSPNILLRVGRSARRAAGGEPLV